MLGRNGSSSVAGLQMATVVVAFEAVEMTAMPSKERIPAAPAADFLCTRGPTTNPKIQYSN